MIDTLKPPDAVARHIARAEARLDRLIHGGSPWAGARDWLAGLWPTGRGSWWSSAWTTPWTSRPADRWSDAAGRLGGSTRAIADELMRLGAAAATAAGTTRHHRPIGKVVLVAAGLGLLAALARRD